MPGFTMLETPDFTKSNALSIALVVPDAKRRHALAAAMTGPQSSIVRECEDYPSQSGLDELARLGCDVVVVDLDGNLGRALSVIGDISSRGPAATVMACSGDNDPTLLRQSMEAGSREFLVESLFAETVDEALARALSRRPSRKKDLGKVLVFVPAKGGVGVTTLAANFAMALTRESSARVVVVDMDFQLGQIALGLGVTAAFSTADALKNADRLDRDFLSTLLVRHASGLAVLSSPEQYNFLHLSMHEGAGKLFRLLREEFDYVVVDTGTYHGHVQEALFEMADKVYLVTELTLPALRNTHRLISYLSAGNRSSALEVVVNRFDSRHADIDENTAMKAMGRPFSWRIPNDYAAARAAQANGVPLATESSPIMKVLVKMARAACGKAAEIEKKAGSRFSFFGSKQLAATLEA